MFSEHELSLLEIIEKSSFYGAVSFAKNVKKQGFMSEKQKRALHNMNNSIRATLSRKYKSNRSNGWDHDDLSEGWDGY